MLLRVRTCASVCERVFSTLCMHICVSTVVGSNAQCLRLRINGALSHVDCMHIANLIGCLLAPILARPFLTPGSIPHTLDGNNPVDIGNIDVTNVSNVGTIDVNDLSDIRTVHVTDVSRWTMTTMGQDFANTSAVGVDTTAATGSGFRFGTVYFIAASLLVASGVMAITLSLALPRRDVTSRRDTSDQLTQRRRRPTTDVCLRVACLYAVFQCIQVGVEATYGCLLLSYAVKGIGWSKAAAGMMAVVYFGSCVIGRGLCLTVVSKASATSCVFGGMCTMLASLLVTLLFGRTHPNVMWLTATMQGVASSAVLPACIIWIGGGVSLTPRLTRTRFVASCLGMVTAPGMVGYCMHAQRPDTFVSLMFGASVVNLLVFAMLRGTFKRRASHLTVDQNNNLSTGGDGITRI